MEELSRLPGRYRGVVLCDLEGMTRKEAALQLGIPEGSVASRLARARALLAKRVTQRGVAFSGASVSAGLGSASAPPALLASTIEAASLLAAGQAAGVVTAKIAALMNGVVKAMFVTKIKSVLALVLVAATVAGAAGLIYQTQAAEEPKDSNKAAQAPTPATPAGKTSPENAKKEPDVLTPEEFIKLRPKEKVTVQFKVTSVTVQEPEGAVVVGYDEGPYIRLFASNKFSVLLRGPASYQIKRLGIEPEKHFSGKVVRATGLVHADLPDAAGPPFNIVVDDLTQFEVVKE